MNASQTGDARKLADGLVTLAAGDVRPLRWVAGADAVGKLERKIAELTAQIEVHRELSCSLDRDDL